MKKYIKPETLVVEVELGSMIAASPDPVTVNSSETNDDDCSKVNDIEFSLWEDEVEE